MTSALNPQGGGGEMAGMHVATILVGPEDYGASHRLLGRALWRSRALRRELLWKQIPFLILWGGLGAVLVLGWNFVSGQADGFSRQAMLRWLWEMLPWTIAITISVAVIIAWLRAALIYGSVAWQLRRGGRKYERDAEGGVTLIIAWNSERFGFVYDGRLQAWPIAELLAWDETDRHVFVVIREEERLVPIPRDQADPAALDQLRRALAAAAVPDLWTVAERRLLAALEPKPRFDDGFSP